MKKLLVGLAALPFLAGIAMAGQPKPLSDAQMDKVTAGQLIEIETTTAAVGIFELNFFPNSVQFGPDGPADPTVINHPADPLPHAFGALICDAACSWGNPVGHLNN